jgi:hypothetical protein
MKSRSVTKIMCLLLAGVMAAGALTAAPRGVSASGATCQTEDWNFPAEASSLLKEVQFTATLLTRDATILESYSRGALSRESHVDRITVVKHHINTMGEKLNRLQAIRHVVTPWQQQAIDSVVPPAVTVAAHTEAAIEHLNDRRNNLWHPDYTDLLRGISDRSVQVQEAVNLHLEMADTQDKLESLQERTNPLGS